MNWSTHHGSSRDDDDDDGGGDGGGDDGLLITSRKCYLANGSGTGENRILYPQRWTNRLFRGGARRDAFTQVNSAFHPSGVGKSSTGLRGWVQAGRVHLCQAAGKSGNTV